MTHQEYKSEAGLKKNEQKKLMDRRKGMGWGNPCKEYLRNILESLRKITVCCLRDWKQPAGGWEALSVSPDEMSNGEG